MNNFGNERELNKEAASLLRQLNEEKFPENDSRLHSEGFRQLEYLGLIAPSANNSYKLTEDGKLALLNDPERYLNRRSLEKVVLATKEETENCKKYPVGAFFLSFLILFVIAMFLYFLGT